MALQYGFHNYLNFSSFFSTFLENVCHPKILGDVFKAVAGAIYIDSGLKLECVWNVYRQIMETQLEYLSRNIPQSPIEELQKLFPRKFKFEKEVQNDRKIFSVCVEVQDFGRYKGIGRDEKSAKNAAAMFALFKIKKNRNPSKTLPGKLCYTSYRQLNILV